jgi:hypothetical protein
MPRTTDRSVSVVKTMAVSSAECERVFSVINLIVTGTRAALHVNPTYGLMLLKLVEPSLTRFDPATYVRSWLAKGRYGALDTKSKCRGQEEEDSGWQPI